jgi:hypothetical protein
MASIPPAEAPIATIGKPLTLKRFLSFLSIDFLEPVTPVCFVDFFLFMI